MKIATRIIVAILLLLGSPQAARSQSYTIMPSPYQTALDNAGHIINNACIWTYVAGTTTPATTYTDTAGTPQTNPIRADSAGRFTAYLLAGSNYKFAYESSCSPPAHGTTLRTADNIAGVPASAANVDVTGTAGETISAGLCVYLSDGSGSKAAGQWFKCDAANPYSSTTPEIGLAPSAIASGLTGTIRLEGSVAGLSSLSVGPEYFIGTAGALTSTAPGNKRHVGHADTATSLILTGDPPPAATTNLSLTCGRLTLTTGVPVTTADVTAATTLYYTPTTGCNQVTLWNGSANQVDTLTEQSLAVPATTSQMYDIFAFDNAGAVNIEVLAWTNDTTRATAITLQNGYLAKAATPARRYVGSFRTTTVSGQTEDSETKRYVYNQYNRARKSVRRVYAAAMTYNYTLTTIRQTEANTANQIDVVVGTAEVNLLLRVRSVVTNVGASVGIGIGEDSTTTISLRSVGGTTNTTAYATLEAVLDIMPAIGRHFYAWNESSQAVNTSSWFVGNGSFVTGLNDGGMIGMWEC